MERGEGKERGRRGGGEGVRGREERRREGGKRDRRGEGKRERERGRDRVLVNRFFDFYF